MTFCTISSFMKASKFVEGKLRVCLRNFNAIIDLQIEAIYIVPVEMGSGGMTFTLSSMTID